MLRTGLTLGLLLITACEPDDAQDTSDTGDTTGDRLNHAGVIDRTAPTMDPQDAYRLGLIGNDRVPYSSVFPGEDTDGDGLYDAFELEQGLDPLNPDTDGDGIHDHWDLLGSEHIDPRFNGGGFAWFDPSRLVISDSEQAPSRSKRQYGLYIFPDARRDVILFGSNRSTPTGFECSNLGFCSFYGYIEGWRADPSLLQVQFVDVDSEHEFHWSILHFSCTSGREGYCRIVDRDLQYHVMQTAPVHGQPLPHWGPDPDADGLSFEAELEQGSDPLRWDTDYDGIPDGAEVRHDLDPTSIDTDDDGVRDLAQVLAETEISGNN